MKTYLIAVILAFILSFVLGSLTIPILRKIKAGQPILKYVDVHKEKNGTPTMGGLFFILSAVIVFFLLNGKESRIAVVSVVIGLAFMVVGFLDDFIKVKNKRNEGLKAYQKIIFQLSIAVFSALFCYKNGLTAFNIPFTKERIDFGGFSIFVVIFIFLATTNSVNLTDGIDGLAGSTSVIYLFVISLIIFLTKDYSYLNSVEQEGIILFCAVTIGALLGFLVFNFNKAKVFMGDTGSLSLGGIIASVSIFTSNSFFIPIIGIMFVLSSISVIVQVVHYKRTKKRIFLMAPLHHHFQLKGVTEGKICYLYSLVSALVGVFCLLFYL